MQKIGPEKHPELNLGIINKYSFLKTEEEVLKLFDQIESTGK
jgi:hypothetical protein